MKERKKLRKLAECAILLAAGFILSLITVYKLPLGGAVTAVSMLPILLAGYRNGIKWGMLTGVAFAVTQLVFDIGALAGWGLTPVVFAGSVVFDYLLAFGVLGLSGLFAGRRLGLVAAAAVCLPLRFLMHVLSGIIFFGAFAGEGYSPFAWSIAYNGSFMLPELIITVIAAFLVSRIPAISHGVSAADTGKSETGQDE